MAQPPRPNPAVTSPRLLTFAEVAAQFGVSERTVRSWARAGRMETVTVRGTRFVPAAEAEALRRGGAR